MARRLCTLAAAATLVAGLSACGSRSIEIAKDDPNYRGARLFVERCSGCHTLDVAGTEGGATKVRDRERVDGPNFNTRCEQADEVLYAIRNGGFSGAIMPENILVGEEAQKVAEFLAEFSGREKGEAKSGENETDAGEQQGE